MCLKESNVYEISTQLTCKMKIASAMMNKHQRMATQAGFWIIITAAFIWIPEWTRMPLREIIRSSVILLFEMLTIASVIYILFPFFFTKGKKLWFFISGFGILVALGYVLATYFPSFQGMPGPDMAAPRLGPGRLPVRTTGLFITYFSAMFPLFASMAIAAFWEIWEDLQAREKAGILLGREKMETELKFLKSQISPHFLLNALNNIYALSISRSEDTSENIMRLSEILRYVLYDCNEDLVTLGKEIKYIEDYIALLKLKREEGIQVDINMPDDLLGRSIHPMVLIPFVENAAKHGNALYEHSGWISISGKAEDNRLVFCVTNTVSAEKSEKDEVSGIGIKNVIKRLDILYGNRYNLDINDQTTSFAVTLRLPLE